MLISFSGLPGSGKSTIARAVARQLGAAYLRIDTIEDELFCLGGAPIVENGGGYVIACKVAEDNLQLGRIVVADCVNPSAVTRQAWTKVALRTGTSIVDVHLVCSNAQEHERRIKSRLPGSRGADWDEIRKRHIEPPHPDALIVDTAEGSVEFHAASVVHECTRRRT